GGTSETYRESRNVELLREYLESIQSDAGSACVALVYIPTKEHIYFPHADPHSNLIYVLQNGRTLRLNDDGWLGFGGLEQVDYDTLLERLNNQRDVVQQLAETLGLHFIDLTPVFEVAILPSAYYPYDSHWS